MTVGALYDTTNVQVGQAVLYVAPAFTPMPADSSGLFDATNWIGKTINGPATTAATLSVTTTAGTQATPSQANWNTTLTAATLKTAIEALSNVGAGKTSVTMSSAGVFTVLFDSSLGAVTLAVTASTGTAPQVTSGLWLPAGGTEQGWQYNGQKSTQDITIEEQSTPVGVQVTSQQVNIAGTLAEDVMQSWQWGLNALKTVTAQGVGQPGKTELNLTDNLVHYAVALEMANKFGLPRRAYIPDTVAVENITIAFRRAAAMRMIPIGFRSVCATNLIRVQEITSPGL